MDISIIISHSVLLIPLVLKYLKKDSLIGYFFLIYGILGLLIALKSQFFDCHNRKSYSQMTCESSIIFAFVSGCVIVSSILIIISQTKNTNSNFRNNS